MKYALVALVVGGLVMAWTRARRPTRSADRWVGQALTIVAAGIWLAALVAIAVAL